MIRRIPAEACNTGTDWPSGMVSVGISLGIIQADPGQLAWLDLLIRQKVKVLAIQRADFGMPRLFPFASLPKSHNQTITEQTIVHHRVNRPRPRVP